jgi:hypothetical protein
VVSFYHESEKTMNDKQIIDGILRLIGHNPELMQQFAEGLGIDEDELGIFIDEVEFPVVGRNTKNKQR